MVTRLYALSFESDLTMEQALAKLRRLTPWEWDERDNDRRGPYVSALAIGEPHWGMVKLLGDEGRFVVNVLVKSDAPEDEVALLAEALDRTIRETLLPALGARDVTEVADDE